MSHQRRTLVIERVKPASLLRAFVSVKNINNRNLKFNILMDSLFILNFIKLNNGNYIPLKLNLLTLFNFFDFINFIVIESIVVDTQRETK